MATLVSLPTVIDRVGQYVTRQGETVDVYYASNANDFGCRGTYPEGTVDYWHKSGRLLADRATDNDIVQRVDNPKST